MTSAAWADGILTTEEISDLALVARLLHVPAEELISAMQPPAPRDAPRTPASVVTIATESATVSVTAPAVVWQEDDAFALSPGDLVVLTGEMMRPREIIEAELRARGFRTGGGVSKKVKLVVAADPDSLSGKAGKARDYGIPIVGEAWLGRMLAG